jgi:hypothetical protein
MVLWLKISRNKAAKSVIGTAIKSDANTLIAMKILVAKIMVEK